MTTRKLDINAAAEIVGLPPSIGDEFWGYGTEEATLGDHREVSACWADWVAFAGAVLRIDRMLAEQQDAPDLIASREAEEAVALRDALRTLCLQREGRFHTEAAWATARGLVGLERRERSW